jgi:hypothetical protein
MWLRRWLWVLSPFVVFLAGWVLAIQLILLNCSFLMGRMKGCASYVAHSVLRLSQTTRSTLNNNFKVHWPREVFLSPHPLSVWEGSLHGLSVLFTSLGPDLNLFQRGLRDCSSCLSQLIASAKWLKELWTYSSLVDFSRTELCLQWNYSSSIK